MGIVHLETFILAVIIFAITPGVDQSLIKVMNSYVPAITWLCLLPGLCPGRKPEQNQV
jgi:hypothetical protein